MMSVSIDQVPLTSFALVQNGVSIIRAITVRNNTKENYNNLKVRIAFEPEFADTVVEHIISLPANESCQITDIQPTINSSYLCNLTEKITARTIVQVLSADGEVLSEEKKELEVLDYSQYWGNSFMSQYLAAFVTPSHIALDPVLTRASELLAQWTGDSSFSAYSYNVPNRPKMILGALYEAIAEQNITYCHPVTTLARYGQKIRTCEDLLSPEKGKRGCCLDMALLMCSSLEAVGMHPLLIMQDEHAFVGCWLIGDMFVDSVNDDPSVITKRCAEGINEIILVEMTAANEGNKLSFDEAVAIANDKIKNVEKFSFVLDVARARLVGVRPIPQRIYNGNEYEIVNLVPENRYHFLPASVSETFDFRKDESGFNRFDLWERRLLDLSTRNNLLNIRFSKKSLRIMVPSLAEVLSLLYNNKEIYIIERPDDWETPINSKELGERISDNDPILELLRKEMGNDRLRAYQDSKTLTSILTGLYRSSRLSIEESGANTLFLAVGFLKWFEQGRGAAHFAPIVLYPIKIERKSADKGYYMVSRGEDALLNETLFEFLKQNYGIELPDVTAAIQNEKGVDIKYILAAVRKAVMEQSKWDVIEELTINIFDFNRFVIWNDIRTNRQIISEHPLVSSLVSGKLSEEIWGGFSENDEFSSADVALPISADSSQLAAIYEAAAGRSFVLHGPPGTGKSQTITNIISNALFHGKRVLFVAEKMAALEVVQKRLAAVGLAPFCLELHSNKTKKSLVMEQLRRTTEVMQKASDDSFIKESQHLDELKRELNSHVEELHKKYPCGLSVYDCFARYSEIDVPDYSVVKISDEYIDALTPDLLREHIETVENYKSTATVVAANNNPLREIGMLVYSPDIRNQIEARIDDIQKYITSTQQNVELFKTHLGYTVDALSKEQYDALLFVAEFIIEGDVPSCLVSVLSSELLSTLKELAELQEKLDKGKTELFASFSEHILQLDVALLRSRWIESEQKWFLSKFLERRSVIKTLSSYMKEKGTVKAEDVTALCDTLESVHSLQREYDEMLDYIGNKFNLKRELKGVEAKQLYHYHNRLAELLSVTALLQQDNALLLSQIALFFSNDSNIANGNHTNLLNDFVSEYKELLNRLTMLMEQTDAQLSYDNEDWLKSVSAILKRWSENIMNLRGKVAYNVVRKQVRESGVDAIVEAFETGELNADNIVKVYRKSLYKHCANHYISQNGALSFFQSILFEDKIKRFRKLCKEFEEITRKELVVRLTAMLPALRKEASQSSDVGYLQKCIRNGCRGVSIRKLFETIPELISRMSPAMLMSPLSVSQYLGKNWPQFDLVIFDEASQMPTCEAVAAISRGKSAVIVGDEHQLPPTSFFMAENFSEQHSETEDLESILEDCLALSMPQKYLLWHYRSKHESLITFSNRNFYKNSLMTFPSNDDLATKVSFEYVNGVYERGLGRNNKSEAKAVVDEIKKRLSNPLTATQSIGVVTFNVNQQSLIEDMLNDMLRKNPDVEKVAAGMYEPVFIKNLENVQGDERDVILFSVGYGRDKYDKVAMNFGPLNRNGGERRLNVAVSRARYEMKIFSSLRADDIDIYRSNAKGVLFLKSFLEYAERGKETLMHITNSAEEKSKDAFVESVAAALKAKGYEVNTNIGSSGYRVDIGVVDTENPDRYLLGILCDGYNYIVSPSAYDRNVTTPAVLSLLGWRTYNIWSVEWWDTPELILNGIISEIERLKADREDVCNDEDVSEDTDTQDEEGVVEQAVVSVDGELIIAPNSAATEYIVSELPARCVDSALFSQGYFTDSVVNDIRTILAYEAPICRRLLIKRLLNSYGIARNGVRINSYLTEVFNDMDLVTSGVDDVFFWKDEEQRENYSGYRFSSREALDIAPEEVAQAVIQVLEEQFAIDEEGLVSETSRLFGYANVRDNVLASMKRGIEYAVKNGSATFDGTKYKIATAV